MQDREHGCRIGNMEISGAAMQCNATSGISMIPLDIVSFKYGRVSSTDKTQIWYRPREDMETPEVAM